MLARTSGRYAETVGAMERICSVDDIVGTLWMSGELGIGVTTGETGHEGENEYSPHGLNRSASEFAFQEFIKRDNFRQPARSDAQTFLSSEDEAGNDDDCEVVEDKSQLREEVKHKDDSSTDTSAIKVDDADSRSSPSEHQGTAESPFQEPEIKAALHPLFSGLHSEMTPTSAGSDPHEMTIYYKAKLAEACLRARQAREGALGLSESVQNRSALHQTNGAASGQFGAEAFNIRTAPTSKPVTSGSSQDQSDDDDCDNEQNLEPGDKKRVKRMLSNRESARRSRRRKQAHLNELESQVAQLRVQNSTLSESLHTTSQKLKDASKDNLQLKTYVEMLKAKLLAASTLHRQLNMAVSTVQSHPPSTHGTQEIPAVSRGFEWDSPHHNLQNAHSRSTFHIPPPMTAVAMAQFNAQQRAMEQSISLTVQQGMKMSRTPSMQRVSSMDHLKKKIRNTVASRSPTSWGVTNLDLEGPSMIPQFSLSSDY